LPPPISFSFKLINTALLFLPHFFAFQLMVG
jgi:hypothetical protein